MSEYTPPAGNVISLDFKGDGYTPPLGNVIALNFAAESGVVTKTQYLFPVPIDILTIPAPKIRGSRSVIAPIGIEDTLLVSEPTIKNKREVIDIEDWQSWQSSEFGYDTGVRNFIESASPDGLDSLEFGSTLIYNKKQFVSLDLDSVDSLELGEPYLAGGVKVLEPYSIDSQEFGEPYLVKYLMPTGIDSLVISEPSISPQILYPTGIASPVISMPDIRDPAIKILGEQHTLYGNQTVWFHTRTLAPKNILAYESGYPVVADPTQFIQTPSLLTSAIFGDTATRNLSFKIVVPAIYDSSFSDYATLTNSNRYYPPKGINSLAMGELSISNKTPSIFINGMPSYDVGMPAIGYSIRLVQPTGFDHLLLGTPTVIKAPELLVNGHESSVVEIPTIWYKDRVIDLVARSIDSFEAGEHTAWYRYRYLAPVGWESSDHSEQEVTHGLRLIDAKGHVDSDFGEAWISQGIRLIDVKGIYEPKQSNHMVGGTQTILPDGYIATLWGERIIPISQSLAPLGFVGVFGDNAIDLWTKYVSPVGYISVGQQPADRWGDIVFYNKLQYILQGFDVNSGLAPPKWSDWTAIENRNRVVGAVSFISQKFGYSQIGNNAAPLLPAGIEPLPITIGMISHGIRTVLTEAIEAPQISTWAVAYNDGRVLAPHSMVNTSYGEHSLVNTRRYFRDWGRFDSLEMGEPAIGYAIRTIDIERRYSIEPPQINLPTIDLYTRYVDLRGYEAAAYGMPSLSIHFNIIAPKWTDRNTLGYATLKNQTPELLMGGHNSEDFGRASIRTQWRYVAAQGDTATLFGGVVISDTDRTIEVRGWQSSLSSQLHTVTKLGTNPYSTQNIFLNNESDPNDDGHGIFDKRLVGAPSLNQNVLYVDSIKSLDFGTAFVWSSNIKVDVGIAIDNVSRNLTVYNSVQSIVIESSQSINNTVALGNPGMSPHTIWAVMEAPQQAKDNHYNGGGEYIGWEDLNKPELRLGEPSLESTIRSINPYGHESLEVGRDGINIELTKRYVLARGVNPIGVGIPEIPFTTKEIQIVAGFSGSCFGVSMVGIPEYVGPVYISHPGLESMMFGAANIENHKRYLYADGTDSLLIGKSKNGDTPFMWQGLRVGEHIPLVIGSGDMSEFGETSISLRIRGIEPVGLYEFRGEYNIENFKDRIRVTRSNSGEYDGTQGISVAGIDSEEINAASIKWAQQFIRPDGNSDQFRKGGYHA